MAKKKHKKKGHRRHRAVSGINVSDVLFAVMGGVGARLVDKVAPKTFNPKMIAGAKILIGVGLPMLTKSGKSKGIATAFGTGVAVIGVNDLLKAFGVLGEDQDATLDISLDGDDDVPTVTGDNDVPTITGEDIPTITGDFDDED